MTDEAVEATCTMTGLTEGSHCSVCNEILVAQEITEKADHTPVTDAAVDATCTEDGLTEGSHCSVCQEVLVAQTVIPAEGHKPVTDSGEPASCTEDGLTEGTHCSVCGKVLEKQDVIEAKGHTPAIDAAVEATCTTTGLTEGSHCSVCGAILEAQKLVPVKGHTPAIDAAVEATCTETGLTEGSHCSVCGVILEAQKLVPVKDHTPAIDAAVEATCTETGLTEGSHCSVCGETLVKQEITEMTDHTPAIDAAVAATCTATGLTEGSHCSVCGEILVKQEITEVTDHTPATDAAKAATCTATGLTEGSHCSVCYAILVAQRVTERVEHTPVTYAAAVEPTCTEAGRTEGTRCSFCNIYLTKSVDLPAKGHTVVTDAAKAATCIATGLTEGSHCSACGEVLVPQYTTPVSLTHTNSVEARTKFSFAQPTDMYCLTCNKFWTPYTGEACEEHTPETDPAVAATCAVGGLTEGSHCAVCKAVLVAQEPTEPTGHTPVTDLAVPSTCKMEGKTEGSHCSTCGEVLVAQQTLPLSEVHRTIAAESVNPGAKGYLCLLCGKTWESLEGEDAANLMSYEKVDLTSQDNSFAVTADGDDTQSGGATGGLQVYQNEEGNYVNLICVITDDNTARYISFESGSKSIKDLIISAEQGVEDGVSAAVTLGDTVEQFGFGFGVDESGATYMYVIENGQQVMFTVELLANGDVGFTLKTENDSQMDFTNENLGFEIELDANSSSLTSGIEFTQKTLGDDSSEDTFIIQPYVESNEQKIGEYKDGSGSADGSDGSEGSGSSGSGIQALEQQDSNNYVDVIEVEEGDEKTVIRKVGFEYVDEVPTAKDNEHAVDPFAKLFGHKNHNWLVNNNEKHRCEQCTREKPHNWKPLPEGMLSLSLHAGDACYCTVCDADAYHAWQHIPNSARPSVCSRCKAECEHNYESDGANGHTCTRCGQSAGHQWSGYWSSDSELQEPNCRCLICGYTQPHPSFDSVGWCSVCHVRCVHSFVADGGMEQCSICGKRQQHEYVGGNNGCVCVRCDYERKHLFSGGKCIYCSANDPSGDTREKSAAEIVKEEQSNQLENYYGEKLESFYNSDWTESEEVQQIVGDTIGEAVGNAINNANWTVSDEEMKSIVDGYSQQLGEQIQTGLKNINLDLSNFWKNFFS